MKFETARMLFFSEAFAAVAVVVACLSSLQTSSKSASVYQTPNTSWSVYVSFQTQCNLSLDSPYLLPFCLFVFAIKLICLSIILLF